MASPRVGRAYRGTVGRGPDIISVEVLVESRMIRGLTAEAQLALAALAARARREKDVARIPALASATEPGNLSAFLRRQRIAVVGIERIDELGLGEMAEDLRRRLEPALDRERSAATIQDVLTASILDELEKRSVPVVALKGVVLAQRLYGDLAGRESRDIDILVRAEQLDEAVSVIRGRLGYDAPVDAVDRNGRPLLHYHLRHARGWPGIEVHWRVHWYEDRSGGAMIDRSSISGGARRLRLVDELVCLLLFYARDGFVGLRNLMAVTAWWDRFGEHLPPEGLASVLAELPELTSALAASASVAEVLTGVPRSRLGLDTAGLGPRQRRAMSLVNIEMWGPRAQLEAEIGLVDLLLSPGNGLRAFVRRQWLLSQSFVDQTATGQSRSFHRRVLSGPLIVRRGARMLRALARTESRAT